MPTGAYPEFRNSYRQGLAKIHAEVAACEPARRRAGDRGHVAVESALAALRSSKFGARLAADHAIRNVHTTLERSLATWFTAACQGGVDGAEEGGHLDEWVNEPYMRDYREYLYWGRLGGILHYYRDEGRGLGTNDERDMRTAIQDRADGLERVLSDLADAPIPQALYRSDVLQRVDRLRAMLQRVRRDFSRSPIRAIDGPSPLHRDENMLRRQFCHVCSLLCLELFGQIRPQNLRDLLVLKATTAQALGLNTFEEAVTNRKSASRELRRSIEKATQAALATAKSRKWVTRPAVVHFSTHTIDDEGELIPRHRA